MKTDALFESGTIMKFFDEKFNGDDLYIIFNVYSFFDFICDVYVFFYLKKTKEMVMCEKRYEIMCFYVCMCMGSIHECILLTKKLLRNDREGK